MRHLALFELPVEAAGGERSLDHVIVVVDGQELVDHTLVVRCVGVVQRLDHRQDLLDLFDALGGADPELTLGVLETLGFDLFDLNYRVVSLLSPLELLI